MSEELKTITISDDGGSYQYAISNQVEFDRLMESSLNTPRYLETVSTKLRVLGYASLVDGGTYLPTLVRPVILRIIRLPGMIHSSGSKKRRHLWLQRQR